MPASTVVRVQLIRESTITYNETLAGPGHFAEVARQLIGLSDREQFVCLHLSTKHTVLSLEVVATGTLNATLVHPREVFKGALLANAHAIALVHNHPSSDCTPSSEDIALTEHLMKAGEILGIKVVDHLVLGDGYKSLRESTQLWHNHPFHQ